MKEQQSFIDDPRPAPKQVVEYENNNGAQQEFISRGGRHDDLPGQTTMFEVDPIKQVVQ